MSWKLPTVITTPIQHVILLITRSCLGSRTLTWKLHRLISIQSILNTSNTFCIVRSQPPPRVVMVLMYGISGGSRICESHGNRGWESKCRDAAPGLNKLADGGGGGGAGLRHISLTPTHFPRILFDTFTLWGGGTGPPTKPTSAPLGPPGSATGDPAKAPKLASLHGYPLFETPAFS